MYFDPSMLGVDPETLRGLMPKDKETSKEEDTFYQKARGVSQMEDPMRIQDLLSERVNLEDIYQEVSARRAAINSGLQIPSEEMGDTDRREILDNAVQVMERTGQSLDIEGEDLSEQVESLTNNLSKLDEVVNSVFAQHQEVAGQLDKQMSPNMAAHLNFGYRAITPEMQSQRIDAMGETEMARGIRNEFPGGEKELDRILGESGGRVPSAFRKIATRWKGGDENELYEQEVGRLTDDQRNTFRDKAKGYILEEGQREQNRVEEEYRSRAGEQGELLNKWSSGKAEDITGDLSRLREKGYVRPEESDRILNDLPNFLKSQDAQQLAANVVSTNRGDNENYSSLFGYAKAGGGKSSTGPQNGYSPEKYQVNSERGEGRSRQYERQNTESLTKEDILSEWSKNQESLFQGLEELLGKDLLTSERLNQVKDQPEEFLQSRESIRHAGNLSNLRQAQQPVENVGAAVGVNPIGDNLRGAGGGTFSGNTFVNNEFIGNSGGSRGSASGGSGGYGGGFGGTGSGSGGTGGTGDSFDPSESDPNSYFGAAALGAQAAGSKVGFGSSNTSPKPQGRLGRVAGGLKSFGVGGLLLGGVSAAQDIMTPGGRSGAQAGVNAVGSMAPGAGSAIGGTIGGLPGAAAGYFLGQAVQPVVSAAADPYLNFVSQQKSYESITGENLQGAGASQSGFGDYLGTMNPLGETDTIQEAQRNARWSNPMLPTEQIQGLTDSLLELGLSTDEATQLIKPLSDTMADFNLSPDFTALLAETGASEGSLGGAGNARFMAQAIQDASGKGFNQQDVTNNVQTAMDTLGATVGYTNAQDTGIAYSNFLSSGTDKTDMLFRNEGTAQNMLQADANLTSNPSALSAMGIDPTQSTRAPGYQGKVMQGRVQMADQLVSMAPGDPYSPQSLQMINSIKSQEPFASVFGNMSAEEIIALAKDKNLTPEEARNSSNKAKNQRAKEAKKQEKRSRGIGVKGEAPRTEARGFGPRGLANRLIDNSGVGFATGMSNRFLGTEFDLPEFTQRNVSRGGVNLIDASKEQQENAGRDDSIGATGQFVKAGKKTADYDKVKLAGGGTLADAANDPKLLAQINKGKQKIMAEGQKMTLAEFNERKLSGETSIGKEGKLRLEGRDSGSGGSKTIIDLSPEAKKWFEKRDVRGGAGGNMSSDVQAAQDRYARNHKGGRLNDSPVYK